MLRNLVTLLLLTPHVAEGLFLSRLVPQQTVSIPLQVQESLVKPCERRQRQAKTLKRFIREELTPRQLSHWLQRRLPERGLNVQCIESDIASNEVLLLSLEKRIYLGPTALGLYMQPKLVCWLRKRARSIEAEAHVCGDEGSVEGSCARLSALHLHTWLTWCESGLQHLQGDSVPCLVLKSKMDAEVKIVEVCKGGSPWLQLLPGVLLSRLSHKAVSKALAQLQGSVAAVIADEYDEWRREYDEMEWAGRATPVAA